MADDSAPHADLPTQIRADSATRGRGLRARSSNRPHGASARLPARRNVCRRAPVGIWELPRAKSASREADASTMARSRPSPGASYGSPPIQPPPLRTGPSLRQPDESAGTVVWCFAYGCDVHQGPARAGTLMTGFRVRPVAVRRCLRPRNGVAPVDRSAEPKESTAAGRDRRPIVSTESPARTRSFTPLGTDGPRRRTGTAAREPAQRDGQRPVGRHCSANRAALCLRALDSLRSASGGRRLPYGTSFRRGRPARVGSTNGKP